VPGRPGAGQEAAECCQQGHGQRACRRGAPPAPQLAAPHDLDGRKRMRLAVTVVGELPEHIAQFVRHC
jgi:hypothetical protein